MDLGELIDELKKLPKDQVVRFGFGRGRSYRGCYEQLAFEPVQDTTIGAMLEAAESCDGKYFGGYKGGDFYMDLRAECWIAPYARTGININRHILAFMTGNEAHLRSCWHSENRGLGF